MLNRQFEALDNTLTQMGSAALQQKRRLELAAVERFLFDVIPQARVTVLGTPENPKPDIPIPQDEVEETQSPTTPLVLSQLSEELIYTQYVLAKQLTQAFDASDFGHVIELTTRMAEIGSALKTVEEMFADEEIRRAAETLEPLAQNTQVPVRRLRAPEKQLMITVAESEKETSEVPISEPIPQTLEQLVSPGMEELASLSVEAIMRRYREQSGKSQGQVAEALSLTNQRVSQLESGQGSISLERFFQWLHAVGINPAIDVRALQILVKGYQQLRPTVTDITEPTNLEEFIPPGTLENNDK